MVQNSLPTSTGPGRRPAFDADQVVWSAIRAFMAKGFAATTLSDLEAATGVDRSTIYNSFGGKDGLYRHATTAYLDRAEAELFAPLSQGSQGLSDILEFLDRFATMLGSQDHCDGCLIVNDMAACAAPAAASRYLSSLDGGLRAALARAAAAGQIDSATVARRGSTLTAAVLGVNIAHRTADSPDTALTMIAGLRAEVASWERETTGPTFA